MGSAGSDRLESCYTESLSVQGGSLSLPGNVSALTHTITHDPLRFLIVVSAGAAILV